MAENGNKAAIVTCGAGGLGAAMAKGLLADGYEVVIADLNEDALETAAQEMSGNPARVRGVPCDVSDPQSVEDLVAEAVSAHGRLDALVNCAGIGPLPA
ncbi:MAG: SDR family NAD(P)-dependent oxidoreductase, partial [Methyloligellaceae bacterium]